MEKIGKILLTIVMVFIFIGVMFFNAFAQIEPTKPIRPVDPDKLRTPIRLPQLPDLVITAIEITRSATISEREVAGLKRYTVSVPMRVIVRNQGKGPAGRFKVGMDYIRPGGATFGVAFNVGGDVTYPWIDSLAPGASKALTGTVSFEEGSDPTGQRFSFVAIADSCAGEEFSSPNCHVSESKEDNNKRTLSVRLP